MSKHFHNRKMELAHFSFLDCTGIVTRNTLVTYDRANDKIGFWKTNCSELWKRLNYSYAPPPAPSAFDGRNTSAEISPSIAPSGLPDTVIPGTVGFKCLNSLYGTFK